MLDLNRGDALKGHGFSRAGEGRKKRALAPEGLFLSCRLIGRGRGVWGEMLANSELCRQTNRITFLLSFLFVATLCGAALKLLHAHPESHRVQLAAEYGIALLGVFWTRALGSRLRDAELPRWSFWPYFLIVFTGCLGAHVLKLTNSLETLTLFVVLQLPALLLPGKPALAETSQQDNNAENVSAPSALPKMKPARPITPLGAIEFAIYILLIAGLWFVLHLLRGDVAGMAMSRALRIALDAASVLLCVPWIFSVRGRLSTLGLTHWYPVLSAIVLIVCAVPFALRVISFNHALIFFVVLQVPAVALRREVIAARLAHHEASEDAHSNSGEVSS